MVQRVFFLEDEMRDASVFASLSHIDAAASVTENRTEEQMQEEEDEEEKRNACANQLRFYVFIFFFYKVAYTKIL